MNVLALDRKIYDEWRSDDNLCLDTEKDILITKRERLELAKEFINSEDYSDITDEDIEEHISDNYYEYPQTCEEFFSNINDIDKMEYTSKSGDKIIFIIYSDY